MLTDYIEKIKPLRGRARRALALLPSGDKLSLSILIILASIAGFGAIRLWLIWPAKLPVAIEENAGFAGIGEAVKTTISVNAENQKLKRQYVASKNGKNYHFPWCSGARSIKEENKIWFNSKEKAERAGYKPAGNCSGL